MPWTCPGEGSCAALPTEMTWPSGRAAPTKIRPATSKAARNSPSSRRGRSTRIAVLAYRPVAGSTLAIRHRVGTTTARCDDTQRRSPQQEPGHSPAAWPDRASKGPHLVASVWAANRRRLRTGTRSAGPARRTFRI